MDLHEDNTNLLLSKLSYRTDAVIETIHECAMSTAAQVGYDELEEHFLGCRILKIRWISEDSARKFFPNFLEEPCNYDPNQILQVDWQTWAIPKTFDCQFETSVIERAESIVVALETLLAGQVFTYGLGPEYNWLHREECVPTGDSLTGEIFDELVNLIEGEWRSDIQDYFEEVEAIPDGIDPRLKPAITRVLCEEE